MFLALRGPDVSELGVVNIDNISDFENMDEAVKAASKFVPLAWVEADNYHIHVVCREYNTDLWQEFYDDHVPEDRYFFGFINAAMPVLDDTVLETNWQHLVGQPQDNKTTLWFELATDEGIVESAPFTLADLTLAWNTLDTHVGPFEISSDKNIVPI